MNSFYVPGMKWLIHKVSDDEGVGGGWVFIYIFSSISYTKKKSSFRFNMSKKFLVSILFFVSYGSGTLNKISIIK